MVKRGRKPAEVRYFKFCKNPACQKRFTPKTRYTRFCDDCLNLKNRKRFKNANRKKNDV